jgi:hypothetical protein
LLRPLSPSDSLHIPMQCLLFGGSVTPHLEDGRSIDIFSL